MDSTPIPFERMIFVCTNARVAGARVSCAGEGRCGEKVLEAMKAYVKEKGLEKRVRVAKSGCQERCEIGPNMVCLPENRLVTGISETDIPALIQTWLAPFTKPA